MATPGEEEIEFKLEPKASVNAGSSDSGDGGEAGRSADGGQDRPPSPRPLAQPPLEPQPRHPSDRPLQPPPPPRHENMHGVMFTAFLLDDDDDLGEREVGHDGEDVDHDGDWGDVDDDDDDDWDDVEVVKEDDDLLEEKKHITMYMSAKKSTPHYVVRYDSIPLNKHTFFYLRKKWNHLLDGKRTYLRPPRDRRDRNGVFRCPRPRPRALENKEPLLALTGIYPANHFSQEIIKILSQHYDLIRQTRGDGSSFYRAFLFCYLENLGQMEDTEAEVNRLMECLERSRVDFCRLTWDRAYFLNPDEYFSSVVSELKYLVDSVAKGVSSDELYKRSLQEGRAIQELLAETEIRTWPEDYKSIIPQEMNALQYCLKFVRPMDAEPPTLPMRAITYALGIPLRAEAMPAGLTDGAAKVRRLDFFPRSGPGKGPFHIVQSYLSSVTAPKPLEQGSGNLFSSDGTPLLTLMLRRYRCDILYRK